MTIFPGAWRAFHPHWLLGLALLITLSACKPSLEDVAATDDPAALAEIIRKSNNRDVVTAAAAKIDDLPLLESLALDPRGKRARDALYLRLAQDIHLIGYDNRLLYRMSVHLEDRALARSAEILDESPGATDEYMQSLFSLENNPHVLMRVMQDDLSNHRSTARKAMERLWFHKVEFKGIDHAFIDDLAINAAVPEFRRRAVELTYKTEIITGAARSDPDETVRAAAAARISDQDLLVSIYETDRSTKVRNAALARITRADYIFHIASTAQTQEVAMRAFHRITAEDEIAQLARKAANASVQYSAAEKTEDQEVLLFLSELNAQHNSNLKYLALDRLEALKSAVWKIEDPVELADVARTAHWSELRRIAVLQTKDRALAVEVAQSDPDHKVRLQAAKSLIALDNPHRKKDASNDEAGLQIMVLEPGLIAHYGELKYTYITGSRDISFTGGHIVRLEQVATRVYDSNGSTRSERFFEANYLEQEGFSQGQTVKVNHVYVKLAEICDDLIEPLSTAQRADLPERLRDCRY